METKLDRVLKTNPVKEKTTFFGKLGRHAVNIIKSPVALATWPVRNAVNEIIDREQGKTNKQHWFDYKSFSGLGFLRKVANLPLNTLKAPVFLTEWTVRNGVKNILNGGKKLIPKKSWWPKKKEEQAEDPTWWDKKTDSKKIKIKFGANKNPIKVRVGGKSANQDLDLAA